MTASRNTGRSTGKTIATSRSDGVLSLSRYDLLLAAIPLVFALTLSTHVLLAVPVRMAVASGALTCALLLVDAFYLNPPSESGSGRTPR